MRVGVDERCEARRDFPAARDHPHDDGEIYVVEHLERRHPRTAGDPLEPARDRLVDEPLAPGGGVTREERRRELAMAPVARALEHDHRVLADDRPQDAGAAPADETGMPRRRLDQRGLAGDEDPSEPGERHEESELAARDPLVEDGVWIPQPGQRRRRGAQHGRAAPSSGAARPRAAPVRARASGADRARAGDTGARSSPVARSGAPPPAAPSTAATAAGDARGPSCR